MENRISQMLSGVLATSALLLIASIVPVARADTFQLVTGAHYANYVEGEARQGTGRLGNDRFSQDFHSFQTSTSGSYSATIGANSSAGSFALTPAGLQATFSHQRDAVDSSAGITQGWFAFTPTVDLTYSVLGTYSTSSGPTSQMVFLAELYRGDVFDGTLLYKGLDQNYSSDGPGAFNLSGTQGNYSHSLVDHNSHILTAGVQYQFLFQSYIANNYGTDAATASGSIDFNLTPTAAAVPLPSTAWVGVVLMGSFGIVQGFRSRKLLAVGI